MRMNIFLYYPGKEKRFAQLLASSLARYDVFVFLIKYNKLKQEISPDRDFQDGPRGNTIWILSGNTEIEWIKNRLSDETQMVGEFGLAPLLVLLGNIAPPLIKPHPLRHVKILSREDDHLFWLGFRQLLMELQLNAEHCTPEEIRFYQENLSCLIKVLATAKAADQYFFTMGRLWFYLFYRSYDEARHWFSETAWKAWDRKEFQKMQELLRNGRAGMVAGKRLILDEILEYSQAIHNVFLFWEQVKGQEGQVESDVYGFYSGEKCARQLTVVLESVILELQNTSRPQLVDQVR